MGYSYETEAAFAGQIGSGSQAMYKTRAEQWTGKEDLKAGHFVAINENGGVKPLEAAEDVVFGISRRTLRRDVYKTGEIADILILSAGDSVWAVVTPETAVKRGEFVAPVKTGANAGTVKKVAASEAPQFLVEAVSNGLAKITKL